MNSVKIDGNITKDPETFSPQNSEFTLIKFSIANNDESRKNHAGEFEKIASFFDVEYWTKNPQHWLQKILKGSPVTVQGRLKQETWTDSTTNSTRSKVKIVAECGRSEGFAVVVHERHQQQQQPMQGGYGF